MSLRRFSGRMPKGNPFAALLVLASITTLPSLAQSLPQAFTSTQQSSTADVEFFEKNIRPILVESCYACHSAKSGASMGELHVDSRAALLKGGSRGPAIVPGDPARSLLIKAIGYQDHTLQMPPRGALSASQVALLAVWIRKGAPWPAEKAAPTAPTRTTFNLQERARHWSFQPIRPQQPPAVRHKGWPHTPIDNFILAKLEAKGLQPAPPADKRTLLRRVTYDLIGLPPTPVEIDAFLADRSPNAYKKVVERLLASPHYGERWARHWLDLVRYAETDGHEFDMDKPNIYRYRDYVIRAFNSDVPYNRFVQEQIAGDLLQTPRRNLTEGYNESIIGTGFAWLGEGTHSPVDLNVDEEDRVANQIDVFGKAFLGLTVGCARCHNHKFDAISTRDYYALSGYLKSARYDQAAIDSPAQLQPKLAALRQSQAQIEPLLIAHTAQHLQQIAEMLPVALLGGTSGPHTAAVEPAAATVQAHWFRYLNDVASHNPADPLYPFAVLAATPSPEAFARARAELASRLQALTQQAKHEEDALLTFEDFRHPDYRDWFVTGEAFGPAPSATPTLHLDASGHRIVAAYGAPIADSGAISPVLQGALRSRTFTIEKAHVLYRLAGHDVAVRLVIDGFQRIRAPIYGGLEFSPTEENLRWYVQDVSKWIGHRAYIEILDHGHGYAALDRIAFSDGDAPTEAPNPQIVRLLTDPGITTLSALATGYRNLLQATAQRWSQSAQTAIAPDSVSLINWLLHASPQNKTSATVADTVPTGLTHLLEAHHALEQSLPEPQRVMAITEGTGFDDRVHFRGNYKTLGDRVPRRFLEACAGASQPTVGDGSGRLALAQRLTSASTPLLPRVMVNRIWQHHFGEGIVRTPDDFGIRGDRPTHPELLDYLAATFVQQGWSIKKMHRLMVLSATYQMASTPLPAAEKADPINLLLHRMPVRRLEAECIRDAILAVSGRLNPTLYGPSVMPYLTPYMQGRGRPDRSGPLDGDGRRSLYLSVRRNFLNPMFLAFDYPVPFTTMGHRMVSSVPAQALTLMNDPFVVGQAEYWASRMLKETADPAQRIREMYVTAFGRMPSSSESEAALAFLQEQNHLYGGGDSTHAWSDLCHVLFNVKEFIFVN